MARLFSIAAFTIAVGLLSFGCTADDEVKRGLEGEFCDGTDTSCRSGLSCVDGICRGTASDLEYDCNDVCTTLRGCGTLDETCLPACLEAVTDWSDRAIEEFGQCFAEEITCAQAADDPQQFCYDSIEIPEDRSERCSLFAETVRTCDASADTEELRKACFRTGRVGTDEAWGETLRCENAVATGICSGVGTCLNDVFRTSFDLPDSEF